MSAVGLAALARAEERHEVLVLHVDLELSPWVGPAAPDGPRQNPYLQELLAIASHLSEFFRKIVSNFGNLFFTLKNVTS